MTETFSFSSTLGSAWKLIKSHWKFLAPAVLATIAIFVVIQMIQGLADRHWAPSLIMTVVSIIVGLAVALGWAHVMLKLIRSGHATWNDFKTDVKLWFPYFVARVITGLFVILAVILMVAPIIAIVMIPGWVVVSIILGIIIFLAGLALMVWLAVRYMFVTFIAIDRPGLRGWDIMKASARMTKGHMFDLLGFSILMLLINVAGAILFFVGLVFTIPLTKIATAYVYNYLKEKASAN